MQVMKAKLATDPKIKNAMTQWAELINSGAFNKSHPSLTWQEAMALMWQGKSTMYLMGNFISTEIPKNLKGKVGFFRFPMFGENTKMAKVAPTDRHSIQSKKQRGCKGISSLPCKALYARNYKWDLTTYSSKQKGICRQEQLLFDRGQRKDLRTSQWY